MFTCSKTYSDIPFAHRQHLHPGHCRFIHGHNWSFTFTFGCHVLDDCGFVVDFGSLQFIRQWIDENLDHACVYNLEDAAAETLLRDHPEFFKAYGVESCSAEGLAKHGFEVISRLLKRHHGDRVFLASVDVSEDDRNAARYAP